jgi:hypothetical protein
MDGEDWIFSSFFVKLARLVPASLMVWLVRVCVFESPFPVITEEEFVRYAWVVPFVIVSRVACVVQLVVPSVMVCAKAPRTLLLELPVWEMANEALFTDTEAVESWTTKPVRARLALCRPAVIAIPEDGRPIV